MSDPNQVRTVVVTTPLTKRWRDAHVNQGRTRDCRECRPAIRHRFPADIDAGV